MTTTAYHLRLFFARQVNLLRRPLPAPLRPHLRVLPVPSLNQIGLGSLALLPVFAIAPIIEHEINFAVTARFAFRTLQSVVLHARERTRYRPVWSAERP